jgi:hypothetical protein
VKQTALIKLDLYILSDEQQFQAYNQLNLPIRFGGSGLTVMNDIKHSAYISSVAHSFEFAAKSPAKNLIISISEELDSDNLYLC